MIYITFSGERDSLYTKRPVCVINHILTEHFDDRFSGGRGRRAARGGRLGQHGVLTAAWLTAGRRGSRRRSHGLEDGTAGWGRRPRGRGRCAVDRGRCLRGSGLDLRGTVCVLGTGSDLRGPGVGVRGVGVGVRESAMDRRTRRGAGACAIGAEVGVLGRGSGLDPRGTGRCTPRWPRDSRTGPRAD